MAQDRITFVANDFKAFLECPICYEPYSHSRPPKLFHCSHTICDTCVKHLTVSHSDHTVKCPLCREPHAVPGEGAGALPTNITLLQLLSTRCVNQCDSCHEDGRNRKCEHCGKLLCQSCLQVHRLQTESELKDAVKDAREALYKIGELATECQDVAKATKENAETLKNKVTDVVIHLVLALGERKTAIINEIDEKAAQAEKEHRDFEHSLKERKQVIEKYCNDVEAMIDGENVIASKEKVRSIKAQCQIYIHEAESHEIKQTLIKCDPINKEEWCKYINTIGSVSAQHLPFECTKKLEVPQPQTTKPDKLNKTPPRSPIAQNKMPLHTNKCKIRVPGLMVWKPRGVAVCPISGELIVTDQHNHRIHVFESGKNSYRYKSSFGQNGCGLGQFKVLGGVAVNSHQEVIVCDSHCCRLQMFQKTGQFLRTITWHNEMSNPYSVDVDELDQMYVADKASNQVLVFDRHGRPLFKFNSLCNKKEKSTDCVPDLCSPMYLAVNKHCTVVTDKRNGSQRIQMLNKDNALLYDMTSSSTQHGLNQMCNPSAVALDNRDNIIVLEGDQIVKVYDKTGRLISRNRLDTQYDFDDPPFMALTRHGNLLITTSTSVLYCNIIGE